jgi:DNA-binding response OmpR family regulator
MSPSLAGRRVLLVEDEMLIAMVIEAALEDEGVEVVGPFGRLAQAIEAAEREQVDVALLDVNLAGQYVYPVADILEGRGIPFLFLTGYGEVETPCGRTRWRSIGKPFRTTELIDGLGDVLGIAAKSPPPAT